MELVFYILRGQIQHLPFLFFSILLAQWLHGILVLSSHCSHHNTIVGRMLSLMG
jgi:hypothetical protein